MMLLENHLIVILILKFGFSFWIHLIYLLTSRLALQNTQTASLQRDKSPLHNKCLEYDTKQSDGEVSVMLELWGMQSTPSLPSFPGATIEWLHLIGVYLWVKLY